VMADRVSASIGSQSESSCYPNVPFLCTVHQVESPDPTDTVSEQPDQGGVTVLASKCARHKTISLTLSKRFTPVYAAAHLKVTQSAPRKRCHTFFGDIHLLPSWLSSCVWRSLSWPKRSHPSGGVYLFTERSFGAAKTSLPYT
jgi:hypothetical protein